MNRVYGSVSLPIWYLLLERRNAKYDSRIGTLIFIFFFVGLYALIPLGNQPLNAISNNMIILAYYIIFYIVFFVSAYFFWKYFVKPYKINELEELAINFFNVGLNLEQINLGLDFDNRLKRNIKNLVNELKKLKKIYKDNSDIKYKTAIDKIINNITKLNNYKTDEVKFLLTNDRLSDKFIEISEILIKDEEYSSIKAQLIELSKILERISKIKITEKYFIDYYTMIGLLIILLLIVLSIVFPIYQSIFAVFLGVFITLLFSKIFRKNLL